MLGIKYIHTDNIHIRVNVLKAPINLVQKQKGKLAIIKDCEKSFLSHHGAKNGAQKRNTNPEESEVFWRK